MDTRYSIRSVPGATVWLLIVALLLTGGCGAAGSPEPHVDDQQKETDPEQEPDPTEDPAFAILDLDLQEGDFWEYRLYYHKSSGSAGGSTWFNHYGRFRVTLGAPVTIDGETAYPIEVSGNPFGSRVTRWKYMARSGNRILGSEDGTTWHAILDAQLGYQPGGGFLLDLTGQDLFRLTVEGFHNQFVDADEALVLSRGGSEGGCETYPGVGTICPGDDEAVWRDREAFVQGVGFVGSYFHRGYSSWDSSSRKDVVCGLVRSSLLGDAPDHDLERQTPHDADDPQGLHKGVPVIGQVAKGGGGHFEVELPGVSYPVTFPDWYEFTLPSSASSYQVDLSLDFTGAPAATDLDLVVARMGGTAQDPELEVLGYSLFDNPATGDPSERLQGTLPPGTYLLGVRAWATDEDVEHGHVEYALRADWQP